LALLGWLEAKINTALQNIFRNYAPNFLNRHGIDKAPHDIRVR
jgi:hypothetical protein